eukprot:2447926-Rhodomonas_salina.1
MSGPGLEKARHDTPGYPVLPARYPVLHARYPILHARYPILPARYPHLDDKVGVAHSADVGYRAKSRIEVLWLLCLVATYRILVPSKP